MEWEFFSPNKSVKATISLRSDGFFQINLYKWVKEVVPEYNYESEYYWEEIHGGALTDTQKNAKLLAKQDLEGYNF